MFRRLRLSRFRYRPYELRYAFGFDSEKLCVRQIRGSNKADFTPKSPGIVNLGRDNAAMVNPALNDQHDSALAPCKFLPPIPDRRHGTARN